ncbi:MAG: nucleotidyltransferase domain-containing protein [Gemmatimonas sp.]
MNSRLTQILSAMMPIHEQTLLLRASLLQGDACRDAWNEWKTIAGNPKEAMAADRWSVKRLLPALYVALRDNNADVDPELGPYLKLAYVREQMRSRTYYRIANEVLSALTAADIPFVMLRGGALAATVYPDPAVRHCHDIALLVRDEDVNRARDTVLQTGRTTIPWNPADGGPAVILRDETTLPIELHTRLLNTPYYRLSWDDVWLRCTKVKIGCTETRVLCAEDALIHVCAHASYSEARWSMRWVADAWHLIRQGNVRWDQVLARANSARVELPLFVALEYLKRALDANVPDSVLQELGMAAANARPVARDIALRGVRAGDNASLGVLFERMPASWSLRATAMYWLMFPSREYVRDVIGAKGGAAALALYAKRPLGYFRQYVLKR